MSKWEKVRFDELFTDCTKHGKKLETSQYLETGRFAIIDQGNNVIAGYTDEENGVYSNLPAIIFGDHTRILKYIDFPFFLGADGVKLLKSKRTDCIDKYLYYALKSVRIENTGYNRHFKWLKESEIPLPPLAEQQKIADTLDKVSHLIALRKEQLSKLDLLVKAKFVEMFGDPVENPMGWDSVELDTISDIVSGITKGRKTKSSELIEVPYMAVSNVKDGYIDWKTVKRIEATQAEIDQYRLLPNDVLMTEGGDPDKLGRGAIITNPPQNCIHQNHIYRVRVYNECLSEVYFAYYLRHHKAKQYFLGCAKQTTGIATVNKTQLKALPVLLPPLALQTQFADYVTQVETSKQQIQQGLEKLETLYQGLMQAYFE